MSAPEAAGEVVVWENTIDQMTWLCKVVRDGDTGYHGRLTVTNLGSGEVILDEAVGLSYAAQFGPDVADVREWEETCINAVDKALGDKK